MRTEFLKYKKHITKIVVEGNTSSVGSDLYNKKLSLKRAATVRLWLIQNDIPADALELVGFGETKAIKAIEKKRDLKAEAQDRRVDFRIYQRR